LRNFAVDCGPTGPRRIGLFNIPRRLFVPSASIKAQAQRHKLYGDAETEMALAELEGAASAVIRKAIRDGSLPPRSDDAHYTLVTYVIFQAERTPTAVAAHEEHVEKLVKKLASFEVDLAPYVDQISVKSSDPVRETLEMAAACHYVALDLCSKLLLRTGKTRFITSDHPVVLYNQFMEKRRKPGSGTGLSSLGLQVFLPLSPDVCLILFDPGVYKVGSTLRQTELRINSSEADVQALNLLQIANAGSLLFFDASVTDTQVREALAQAEPLRLSVRTCVNAYPNAANGSGTSEHLIHYFKKDLRAGSSFRV
jgi:hypothetical protein